MAPGFLAARSVGQPRAGVAAMRDAVLAIRRLLAGDPVTFGPTESRLRQVSQPPPPVYLLAAGPRMVELAGEVADGALVLAGLHPAAVAAARRALEAGARRGGRSLAGFTTIFIVPFALSEGGEPAWRWLQRWFAPGQPWLAYPSATHLSWLRQAGLTVPDPPTPEAITDDDAARLADALGLFGSPEACRDRLLRAREEAGVDHVFLFPAHTLASGYELPRREIDAFRQIIRPRL